MILSLLTSKNDKCVNTKNHFINKNNLVDQNNFLDESLNLLNHKYYPCFHNMIYNMEFKIINILNNEVKKKCYHLKFCINKKYETTYKSEIYNNLLDKYVRFYYGYRYNPYSRRYITRYDKLNLLLYALLKKDGITRNDIYKYREWDINNRIYENEFYILNKNFKI